MLTWQEMDTVKTIDKIRQVDCYENFDRDERSYLDNPNDRDKKICLSRLCRNIGIEPVFQEDKKAGIYNPENLVRYGFVRNIRFVKVIQEERTKSVVFTDATGEEHRVYKSLYDKHARVME